MLAPLALLAQEQRSGAPSRTDIASTSLEEVLVTAQRKEQSVLEVPISMTVVSQSQIEMQGMKDIAAYAGNIPGIGFDAQAPTGGQQGYRVLTLRGVSASGPSTVAFYINDSPVRFTDPHLFDVNRIEVLRGPQGMLYGQGSMGGTLKMVLNEPDPTAFSTRVKTTYSDVAHGGGIEDFDGGHMIDALVNIPILNGRGAVRVTGFSGKTAGYIDNVLDPDTIIEDVNRISDRGGRISLKLNLTDDLSVQASHFTQRKKEHGENRFTTILNPAVIGDATDLGPVKNFFLGDALRTHAAIYEPAREDFSISDLTVDYDMGSTTLTGNVAYTDYYHDDFIDSSQWLAPVNLRTTDRVYSLSSEVRLASKNWTKVDWQVGAFYTKARAPEVMDWSSPTVLYLLNVNEGRSNTKAVFGELTYHVTSRLDATLGARWYRFFNIGGGYTQGQMAGQPDPPWSGYRQSGVSPRIALDYLVAPGQHVYVTSAQGVRPGREQGPRPSQCNIEDPGDVESDSLWSYEVGYKGGGLFDGRVSLTAAAYYIDWKDIPQTIALQCGFSATANVGTAEVKGAEAEITFAPLTGLTLSLGGSYIDAALGADAPFIQAKKGDRLEQVPEWKFSGSGTYTWPLSPTTDAYANVYYQYTGDEIRGFDTRTAQARFMRVRPSYRNVGMRLGATFGAVDFSFFGSNLLDERPRLGTFNFVSPELKVGTLQPRTFGIEVDYHFN
jgi:outer membrane receptor protein involved in Fe transport